MSIFKKRSIVFLLVFMIVFVMLSLKLFAAGEPSYITIYPDGTYSTAVSGSEYDENKLLSSGDSGPLNSESEIVYDGDLNIWLADGVDLTVKSIIVTGGMLTVEGSGTLSAFDNDTNARAIRVGGSITINGATVSGTSDKNGVLADGDITVTNGGSLSGECTSQTKEHDDQGVAMSYSGLTTESRLYANNGGSVYGKSSAGGRSNCVAGIYVLHGIEIDGGTVNGQNTLEVGNSYGVYLNTGTIAVKGGGLLSAYGTCGIYSHAYAETGQITVFVGDEISGGSITSTGTQGNGALYTHGGVKVVNAQSKVECNGGLYINGNLMVEKAVVSSTRVGTTGDALYVSREIHISDGGKVKGEVNFNGDDPDMHYPPVTGILADSGITVTGEGSTLTGISDGHSILDGALGAGVLSYSGPITTEQGGLIEGHGNRAGVAIGVIFWGSGFSGDIVSNGGIIKGIGTADNSSGIYLNRDWDNKESQIIVNSGEVIGISEHENGTGVLGGNIKANGGSLTGKGYQYGINSAEWIEANGGKIYGYAPYYAIYTADGNIKAAGADSLIMGSADNRDNSASIATDNGAISAENGGTIYEYYQMPIESFNSSDAVEPYIGGLNMKTFSDYNWSNGMAVSGGGLITTSETNTALNRLTGTRMANVPQEIVALDGNNSSHVIDIPVTLSYTGNPSGGGNPGGPGNPGNPGNSELIIIGEADPPLAELESDSHIWYINGYPDITVRPDNNISRAEVATIFYRLLSDSGKDVEAPTMFPDVSDSAWYSRYVNYMSKIGIIEGYEDSTFRPNGSITRAEFAKIASKFDNLILTTGIAFADVPEDFWAAGYINSSYIKGWINGYKDHLFKPNEGITRAEVAKIVNTMLIRLPKTLPDDINPYIDIMESHWAYVHIMEASIVHDYERDGTETEYWTEHYNHVDYAP